MCKVPWCHANGIGTHSDTTRGCRRTKVTGPPVNDVFGKPLEWATKDGCPPAGAHCCRAVALSYPFLDYDASYKAAVAGNTTFTRQDGAESGLIPDVLTVGPMIRLVGVVDRNPYDPDSVERTVPRKVWRCVHCNEDNGFRCDIYANRPQMCRSYPTSAPEGRCEFRTCGSVHCPNHPSKEPHELRY